MNWYKKAQKRTLYVMRGVSGSGKSTAAKSLPGVTKENIFSTDDLIADNLEDYNAFFENMKKNEDWSPIAQKHMQLASMLEEAMKQGRTPLVLDNMNLEAWQCKRPVQMAIENGYNVVFIDVGTGGKTVDELAQRNRHGVDRETLQRMVDKYEAEGPLTVERVLKSEKEDELV